MDFDFGADDDVDEFAAEVDGDGGQDEAYQRDCLLFLIDARASAAEGQFTFRFFCIATR